MLSVLMLRPLAQRAVGEATQAADRADAEHDGEGTHPRAAPTLHATAAPPASGPAQATPALDPTVVLLALALLAKQNKATATPTVGLVSPPQLQHESPEKHADAPELNVGPRTWTWYSLDIVKN